MESLPNKNQLGFFEMNIRIGSKGVQIDANEAPEALDDMPLKLLEDPVSI